MHMDPYVFSRITEHKLSLHRARTHCMGDSRRSLVSDTSKRLSEQGVCGLVLRQSSMKHYSKQKEEMYVKNDVTDMTVRGTLRTHFPVNLVKVIKVQPVKVSRSGLGDIFHSRKSTRVE